MAWSRKKRREEEDAEAERLLRSMKAYTPPTSSMPRSIPGPPTSGFMATSGHAHTSSSYTFSIPTNLTIPAIEQQEKLLLEHRIQVEETQRILYMLGCEVYYHYMDENGEIPDDLEPRLREMLKTLVQLDALLENDLQGEMKARRRLEAMEKDLDV